MQEGNEVVHHLPADQRSKTNLEDEPYAYQGTTISVECDFAAIDQVFSERLGGITLGTPHPRSPQERGPGKVWGIYRNFLRRPRTQLVKDQQEAFSSARRVIK